MTEHKNPLSLLRESLFLSFLMILANVANVLFQVEMCRRLTASDYGVLMAMVGIIYILNVPAETLRTVMAFFAARQRKVDQTNFALISGLYDAVMKRLLVFSVGLLVLLSALTPWMMQLFHLEGPGPLLASALVCLSILILTTFQGVLQGTGRLGWYGLSMNIWFWGRLVFSVVLVSWGFRATGALGGMIGGILLAILIPRLMLHQSIFQQKTDVLREQVRPLYRYTLHVMVAYVLFMVLANIDVIMVKHYFNPEQAGIFSQGAMLAHILWLIPLPIVMAMFPKVVHCAAVGINPLPLLYKALAVSLVAVGPTALVLGLGRNFIFSSLFHSPQHSMATLLPLFLAAMFPVALLYVLVNYELALDQARKLWPTALAVLAAIALLVVFHSRFEEVLWVLLGVSWSGLLLQSLVLGRSQNHFLNLNSTS